MKFSLNSRLLYSSQNIILQFSSVQLSILLNIFSKSRYFVFKLAYVVCGGSGDLFVVCGGSDDSFVVCGASVAT